jgi:hypothetical protein
MGERRSTCGSPSSSSSDVSSSNSAVGLNLQGMAWRLWSDHSPTHACTSTASDASHCAVRTVYAPSAGLCPHSSSSTGAIGCLPFAFPLDMPLVGAPKADEGSRSFVVRNFCCWGLGWRPRRRRVGRHARTGSPTPRQHTAPSRAAASSSTCSRRALPPDSSHLRRGRLPEACWRHPAVHAGPCGHVNAHAAHISARAAVAIIAADAASSSAQRTRPIGCVWAPTRGRRRAVSCRACAQSA